MLYSVCYLELDVSKRLFESTWVPSSERKNINLLYHGSNVTGCWY